MFRLKLLVLSLSLPLSLMASTTTVNVSSNVFTPNSITVNVGDTVHWANVGGSHNVVADSSSFPSSGSISSGWTYDWTFSSAGAFPYYCQAHGCCGGAAIGSTMNGVVNVAATSPSETPSITASPTDVPPGSTATITPTVTPTLTPGSPVIQIFDKAPEILLAPNPLKVGETVCLYSGAVPAEAEWEIYNTALQRVAHLSFSGPGLECWDTKAAAPGLYYVDVKWVLPDAKIKRAKQKVVLWR